MRNTDLLSHTLDLVVSRVGDPAPLVFARLFVEAPEHQALFCNDTSGAVRGEMFMRALECLQDAAGPCRFAPGLVASEHQTHLGYGVSSAQFVRFFEILVAVFRQALGRDWTPEIEQAWADAVQRVARSAA